MTSQAVPPEILRKLRAMLSMTVARGASPQEADNCLRMATAIMEKYGLSHSDVEMDDGKIRPEQIIRSETEGQSGMMSWEKKLPRVVGDLMAVVPLLDLPSGGPYRILFYGLPSDVALAKEVYKILKKEIWKLSLPEGDSASRRSFCDGCVQVLRNRAYALKKERDTAVKPTNITPGFAVNAGSALVVVKQNQLEGVVRKIVSFQPVSIRGSSYRDDSFTRGKQAGEKINLGFGTSIGQGGAQ